MRYDSRSKRPIFQNASALIFNRAHELRDRMTVSENRLWERLSNKKLMNMKFRRQHPCGKFILDFYCHQIKLCIEVDGKIHDNPEQKTADEFRNHALTASGITVIRFSNEDVLNRIDFVIDAIGTKIIQLQQADARFHP